MTRNHRRWHAGFWLVLGPVLVAGFVAGLLARPTPVAQPAPSAAPGGAGNVDLRPKQPGVTP
jgi:hypothetical protein